MKLSFLMLVFLLFSSCSSKKQIVYIQDYEKKEADGSLDTDDQYDPFSDLDEEIILDQEDKKEA